MVRSDPSSLALPSIHHPTLLSLRSRALTRTVMVVDTRYTRRMVVQGEPLSPQASVVVQTVLSFPRCFRERSAGVDITIQVRHPVAHHSRLCCATHLCSR